MKFLIPFLLITLLTNCTPTPKTTLADFINLDKVHQVIIYNNSGEVEVTGDDMRDLLERLGKSKFQEGLSIKPGSVAIKLIADVDTFYGETRTHGEMIVFSFESIDDSVFKMEGINFDNYR